MKVTDFLASSTYRAALLEYMRFIQPKKPYKISSSGYSIKCTGTWSNTLSLQKQINNNARFGYQARQSSENEGYLWLPDLEAHGTEIDFLTDYTTFYVPFQLNITVKKKTLAMIESINKNRIEEVERDSPLRFMRGFVVFNKNDKTFAVSAKNATQEELFIYLSDFWERKGGYCLDPHLAGD